jgi:hypothetical protein
MSEQRTENWLLYRLNAFGKGGYDPTNAEDLAAVERTMIEAANKISQFFSALQRIRDGYHLNGDDCQHIARDAIQ